MPIDREGSTSDYDRSPVDWNAFTEKNGLVHFRQLSYVKAPGALPPSSHPRTAVLSKTSHANCCTTLTNRPLRPREGRCDPVKADLSEWCNSWRARFLRERLYMQNTNARSRAQGCTSGRSDRPVKRKLTHCTSARRDVSPPDKKPLSGSDPRQGPLSGSDPRQQPVSGSQCLTSAPNAVGVFVSVQPTFVMGSLPLRLPPTDHRFLLVARSDRRPPPALSSYALRMAANCTIRR